jgi:molybdopterin-guanine dinucleotide biosynthesis protein A
MGRDKAWLPFGPETLLQRTLRVVAREAPLARVAVVAAEGQSLPPLPEGVRLIRDRAPHAGPLAAFVRGWEALGDDVDLAYVTGCDAPLLLPGWIAALFAAADDAEAALPIEEGRIHVLSGVYRASARRAAEQLLAAGERSLRELASRLACRRIEAATLRGVDPELRSLLNVNRPADYAAALRLAGAPAPGEAAGERSSAAPGS